jgi:hypothetical protein
MRRRGPTYRLNLRHRLGFVTSVVGVLALWASPVQVQARAFLPPSGKIFAGVAGDPVSAYQQAVGQSPAVYEAFSAWGEYLPGMFQAAAEANARLMISITTASGPQEMITPGGIARGDGDAWLISLCQAAAASRKITYVRPMDEMDTYWNPYGAYNSDGSARDADHSTAAYKRAWKRMTLILRGGSLAHIDSELHRLGMPALHASQDLPTPQIAMLWVPQVAGAPDIAGNQPRDYWPGKRWVDWVGTDFYSKFPNFTGLNAFYKQFPGEPFLFGEYALWGSDSPAFVNQLFAWVTAHQRTRMLIYNQGVNPVGPFRLSRFPAAANALRAQLSGPKFTP